MVADQCFNCVSDSIPLPPSPTLSSHISMHHPHLSRHCTIVVKLEHTTAHKQVPFLVSLTHKLVLVTSSYLHETIPFRSSNLYETRGTTSPQLHESTNYFVQYTWSSNFYFIQFIWNAKKNQLTNKLISKKQCTYLGPTNQFRTNKA